MKTIKITNLTNDQLYGTAVYTQNQYKQVQTQADVLKVGFTPKDRIDYANLTILSNPDVLPSNTPTSCDFSNDNKFLACNSIDYPYVYIYQISGDILTKITNPAVLPLGGAGVKFSNNSNFLFCGSPETTRKYVLYSISGTTFTSIALAGTLPTVPIYKADFSPDDKYLALGGTSSAASAYSIWIYKFNGTTYQYITNFTVSLNLNDLRFSKTGLYLAAGFASSQFLRVYKINPTNDTFTPLTISTGGITSIKAIDFNDDDTMLITASIGSSGNGIYPFTISNDVFTIQSLVAVPTTTQVPQAMRYTPASEFIFLGYNVGVAPFNYIMRQTDISIVGVGEVTNSIQKATYSIATAKNQPLIAIGAGMSPYISIFKVVQ